MTTVVRKGPKALSKMPRSSTYHAMCLRFRTTRIEAGFTQQDMADAVNTTLSMIKQIETGRVVPNLHIIRCWHKEFRRSYDWIIDGK